MESHNGLDIEQDLDHYRRSEKLKKIMLLVLGIILLAVLAGAAGHGPLSYKEEVSTDKMLSAKFYSVVRYRSQSELKLHVNTAASNISDTLLEVSFPSRYVDMFTVESILPEPDRMELDKDMIVFCFKVRAPAPTQEIIFKMRPRHTLTTAEGVMTAGNSSVRISQFILP